MANRWNWNLVKVLRVINILIALVLFTACSNNRYIPVSERSQPSSTALSQHRVSRGESLFSIAWRYGLNYKNLAKINGIAHPYVIYPGQTIQLKGRPKSTWRSAKKAPQAKAKSSSKTTSSKKYIPAKTPKNRSVKASKTPVKATSKKGYSTKFSWQWPARGPLLKKYSQGSAVNKGIDIGGKKGESVITAGPGRVVYSGDGLRGYGKLVIVKHNTDFLSAYAHNSRLLVKEGQVVKARQKIAEMGSSGTDKTMLHFEIRRDGKPVDPLRYLPRR